MNRIACILAASAALVSHSGRTLNADDVDASKSASGAAVAALKDWAGSAKSLDPATLPESLRSVPMTRDDAQAAARMLWKAHVRRVREEREHELASGTVELDDKRMPFTYKKFGEKPAGGRSLWISMHGGGGAPTAVNDRQWENQKKLYTLQEGIYLTPRAPTDTWDLWHQGHIDALFARLIENMVIVEGVDPNRVYVMGYSAGGDGVYQLAPRMADRFAAAAMMAGHPNESQPLGLRNLPFALLMGGNDAAYKRNQVAREWADKLDGLRADDPGGYTHFVKIFEGKGHWMGGEDKVALPWMAAFRRNIVPDQVAWRQDDVTHDRLYWLGMDKAQAKAGQVLVVRRSGQDFRVERAEGVREFRLILSDRMVDLDEPVRVLRGDRVLFEGRVPRTAESIVAGFVERPDPTYSTSVRIDVKLEPLR